ncbi:conserved hypothetical protein [uncultured Defluviicoccus sp.]|uniref:Uncharacterized protein n=1 Tax=metagenome TaxID=256318 RepID=A0A380TCL8_9ZZZZ|nr:conserved hypothetical protein [uncultured Defluviicoccus sp.]
MRSFAPSSCFFVPAASLHVSPTTSSLRDTPKISRIQSSRYAKGLFLIYLSSAIIARVASKRERPVLPIASLPINNMAQRHSGLTEAIAKFYTEAARVCLDRHHESPIDFVIKKHDRCSDVVAAWEKTNAEIRHAWANEIDTTEAGAYACTLAAVELSEGLFAVRRAETKTGADYYVAPAGTSPEDLEHCIRLEVSGTDCGSRADVAQRLKEKVEQAQRGISNLPALAGVVGFRVRLIVLSPLQSP